MKKNVLITAEPHVGKSTLLSKVISSIERKKGFYAREIRKGTERIGFEFVTNRHAKNEAYPLASVGQGKLMLQVGKYTVTPEHLDTYCAWSLNLSISEKDFLYIDEIGQMQLLSKLFPAYVRKCLDSEATVIATISKVFEHDFIQEIKKRDDIILIELTKDNRNEMEAQIHGLISKIEKARAYVTQPHRFSFTPHGIIVHSQHSRRVVHLGEKHSCTCDFFLELKICSHIIAAEEIFKKKKYA